jgi:hypothetical protein
LLKEAFDANEHKIRDFICNNQNILVKKIERNPELWIFEILQTPLIVARRRKVEMFLNQVLELSDVHKIGHKDTENNCFVLNDESTAICQVFQNSFQSA